MTTINYLQFRLKALQKKGDYHNNNKEMPTNGLTNPLPIFGKIPAINPNRQFYSPL